MALPKHFESLNNLQAVYAFSENKGKDLQGVQIPVLLKFEWHFGPTHQRSVCV